MALTTKIHSLYGAVKLGTDYIDQNARVSFAPGIQKMLLSDGVDDQFVAIAQQDARVQVSTSAIKTALGLSGISGLKIVPTSKELDLWLRLKDSLGTYAAGASHLQVTGHNGLFYPVSINADNASASIDYEFAAFYDGSNEPLVFTASQALSGTPTVDEAFVAGKVAINGTELEGVQSISIDLGIRVRPIFTKGQVWPTYLDIIKRQPTIRVQTVDATAINTFGLDGTPQGDTDSEVYLRAVTQNGTRVANGTASHIKVAMDAGVIHLDDVSGDVESGYVATVVMHPTYDRTNDVLAITAGSAIS